MITWLFLCNSGIDRKNTVLESQNSIAQSHNYKKLQIRINWKLVVSNHIESRKLGAFVLNICGKYSILIVQEFTFSYNSRRRTIHTNEWDMPKSSLSTDVDVLDSSSINVGIFGSGSTEVFGHDFSSSNVDSLDSTFWIQWNTWLNQQCYWVSSRFISFVRNFDKKSVHFADSLSFSFLCFPYFTRSKRTRFFLVFSPSLTFPAHQTIPFIPIKRIVAQLTASTFSKSIYLLRFISVSQFDVNIWIFDYLHRPPYENGSIK